MTTFIRMLEEGDKKSALDNAVAKFRANETSSNIYAIDIELFETLPSRTFAYWVSEGVRQAFVDLPRFSACNYEAQFGGSTKDDFRFLRLWWESGEKNVGKWLPFAKGGALSPFYADIYLSVNWKNDAEELEAAILKKYPYLGESANWVLHRESSYGRAGITWTRRTKSRFAPRILPAGCIFSENGLSAFVSGDSHDEIFSLLAILCSTSFRRMIEVQLSAADARAGGAANSYEIGIIASSPVPRLSEITKQRLSSLARDAWLAKRSQDLSNESSHAFLLPTSLIQRASSRTTDRRISLDQVEAEISRLVADAYGLNLAESIDRTVLTRRPQVLEADDDEDPDDDDGNDPSSSAADVAGLLGWSVGVSFGRFDVQLATGQRTAPPEPVPFDRLPAKSPGMLPEGATPFHINAGILVDDHGHGHDLARVVEDVLSCVGMPARDDLRRWLQRDFFAFHLQRYSKSRRKAPVYWPLATASGSYTLWVYYPSLGSQTLYTAINDFVEPKLAQVAGDVAALRDRGTVRLRDEEKRLENLEAFELELIDLRDQLLKIAPTFKPDHDDGVQINAAPLWRLFRHKPWQKVLRDTWTRLEKGDYDWAHVAMNYWPNRVRERCRDDRSLAIAHGLEALYIAPSAKPKKSRGKPAAEADKS